MQLTDEELVKRYNAGERDFHGVTVPRRQVGGTSFKPSLRGLRGINLSNATLENVSLDGDFSGANFHGARMLEAYISSDANFQGADLSGVYLAQAKLNWVNLSGLNLERANFTQAELKGAKFHRANLRDAGFWKANLVDTELNDANLAGANLSCSTGPAFFDRAILDGANLDESTHSLIMINRAASLKGTQMPDGTIRGQSSVSASRPVSSSPDKKGGVNWAGCLILIIFVILVLVLLRVANAMGYINWWFY